MTLFVVFDYLNVGFSSSYPTFVLPPTAYWTYPYPTRNYKYTCPSPSNQPCAVTGSAPEVRLMLRDNFYFHIPVLTRKITFPSHYSRLESLSPIGLVVAGQLLIFLGVVGLLVSADKGKSSFTRLNVFNVNIFKSTSPLPPKLLPRLQPYSILRPPI